MKSFAEIKNAALQAMRSCIARGAFLIGERRAVTSLEYGIVATFLCLSLLAIFRQFGAAVTSMFNSATSGI